MCCWLCRCIKRRRCVSEYQSLHFHLSLVCSLSEDNILMSLIAVRLFRVHRAQSPHLLCCPATSAAVCHLKTECCFITKNVSCVLLFSTAPVHFPALCPSLQLVSLHAFLSIRAGDGFIIRCYSVSQQGQLAGQNRLWLRLARWRWDYPPLDNIMVWGPLFHRDKQISKLSQLFIRWWWGCWWWFLWLVGGRGGMTGRTMVAGGALLIKYYIPVMTKITFFSRCKVSYHSAILVSFVFPFISPKCSSQKSFKFSNSNSLVCIVQLGDYFLRAHRAHAW